MNKYGDVYVTTCYDAFIPRVNDAGKMVLCEGYYCQVYSNGNFENEIDNFCLAKGFEIADLSEEAVDAGIRAYLCA